MSRNGEAKSLRSPDHAGINSNCGYSSSRQRELGASGGVRVNKARRMSEQGKQDTFRRDARVAQTES